MRIRLRSPTGAPPRKLSVELAELRDRSGERAVTLREVLYVLHGRAYMLLVLLLALPFVTPIPLPGLAIPFGLGIALISARIAAGQRPWLPMRLQRKQLPPGFFSKVFFLAEKVLRLFEKFLRPRLTFLTDTPLLVQLHGLFMLVAALALVPPIPIPLTNAFPAWVILLMAAGMLERDGLFIIAAYVMFVVAVIYFIFLGEATRLLILEALHWLRS